MPYERVRDPSSMDGARCTESMSRMDMCAIHREEEPSYKVTIEEKDLTWNDGVRDRVALRLILVGYTRINCNAARYERHAPQVRAERKCL